MGLEESTVLPTLHLDCLHGESEHTPMNANNDEVWLTTKVNTPEHEGLISQQDKADQQTWNTNLHDMPNSSSTHQSSLILHTFLTTH